MSRGTSPELSRKMAAKSAERMASLIRNNAPDTIIASEWALLWRRLCEGYSPDLLERGIAKMDDIWQSLKDDERMN